MVYTGSGVEKGRAARLNARIPKRKKISTARLIRGLSLMVLLVVFGTYLLIGAAHSINYKNQLRNTRAYQIQVVNRINTVRFEIQRELSPDNLIYNAQTRLGMVHAAGILTASLAK